MSQNDENDVSCFRYHKGTDFQANHNLECPQSTLILVVLDTTKVQIFKQITTELWTYGYMFPLFQIPQRYRFSSKSQQESLLRIQFKRCFRYHKGTDFQANHNIEQQRQSAALVVLDTTKVQIFKQITTKLVQVQKKLQLFQIPQRYRFSSKSQHKTSKACKYLSCFRYHKGTDFQANHNKSWSHGIVDYVVLDTTKVQIFKQITTAIPYKIA